MSDLTQNIGGESEQSESQPQPQTPENPQILGPWIKSSYSGGNGGSCVLVAETEHNGRAVRHSQDTSENPATLFFSQDEWAAFIRGANNGEFGDF